MFWTPAISTTCSPVLARPSTCRSFRSDKDSSSSLHAILLAWTSSLCQGLLQLCTTCPKPNPVPQTYGLLKQLPIPRSLGIHIYGFHREAPSIFRLYLDSSPLLIVSQAVTLHPNSWYHLYSTCTTLLLHVFSKHGVPSMSLLIVVWIHISLLPVLGTALTWSFTSLLDIILKRGQTNELSDLWKYLESIATSNKTIGLKLLH